MIEEQSHNRLMDDMGFSVSLNEVVSPPLNNFHGVTKFPFAYMTSIPSSENPEKPKNVYLKLTKYIRNYEVSEREYT